MPDLLGEVMDQSPIDVGVVTNQILTTAFLTPISGQYLGIMARCLVMNLAARLVFTCHFLKSLGSRMISLDSDCRGVRPRFKGHT